MLIHHISATMTFVMDLHQVQSIEESISSSSSRPMEQERRKKAKEIISDPYCRQ